MNDGDAWSNKLDEVYAEMLLSISAYLKYNFTYTQIKKEGYFPQLYQNVENELFLLRLAMMELLNGKSKIKVEIHDGHNNRDTQGAEAPWAECRGGASAPNLQPQRLPYPRPIGRVSFVEMRKLPVDDRLGNAANRCGDILEQALLLIVGQ